MNAFVALALFCGIGWIALLMIPGIDPYLVLTLAISTAPISMGGAVIAVLLLGGVAESLALQAPGSVIGPLLLGFAMVRWVHVHVFDRRGMARFAWFCGASVCYYWASVVCIGGALRMGTILPHLLGNAGCGFFAAMLLARWLRWRAQPRERRAITIGSHRWT